MSENKKSYSYKRELAAESGYDVVVAGGGPGGTAAAICAARLGARVLLLEATGCLGGMGTSALVSNWFELADGERSVVGGLMTELLETMHSRGFFRRGVDRSYWTRELNAFIGYNPEGLKLLLDELCQKAGAEIRFFTRVVDVDITGQRIDGVITHNIEGLRYVGGRTFIDATGDAVVTDLCGAPCREAGRDTKHIMAPTLCSIHAAVDCSQFDAAGEQEAVLKAIADGFFSQPDRHVPGLFGTGRTTAIMNAGHLFGTNALKCRSLSDAMIRGRQFAREYGQFFRKYVKGCDQMEMVATGSLLGVRESRRIVGEYELNYEDFKARRSFPDQIAIYKKSIDVHVHDTSVEQWERYTKSFLKKDRLGVGEHYGLPYGILVPRGMANLWIAGRCNSSDPEVHGAIRDQPACYMMGQAAGTAAVQSLRTGQPACDLDTADLVETLREKGAMLPQDKLSRQMTRA